MLGERRDLAACALSSGPLRVTTLSFAIFGPVPPCIRHVRTPLMLHDLQRLPDRHGRNEPMQIAVQRRFSGGGLLIMAVRIKLARRILSSTALIGPVLRRQRLRCAAGQKRLFDAGKFVLERIAQMLSTNVMTSVLSSGEQITDFGSGQPTGLHITT
jgi:hypothetical protein